MPKEDTQWKPGQSGNPSGRPKGTLKDYVRKKFMEMTEKEKEEFLKKIEPETIWKMGEGNPQSDITSAGEKINPIPIINVIPANNSNNKNNADGKENQDSAGRDISQ